MSDKSKFRVVLEFQLRETIETFDFKAIGEKNSIVDVYVILMSGYTTILGYNINTKEFYSTMQNSWNEDRNPVLMWCPKSNFKITFPMQKH